MLQAYQTGIISKERMHEALSRILGLKAKMRLHKKSLEELVPSPEALSVIGCQEHKDSSVNISKDAITLVKSKEEGILPLNPNTHKKIMIVYVKGAPGPMDFLMKLAMGGKGPSKNPAEDLKDRLIEKVFDAFIYESPLEKIQKQIAAGEKPSLNVYFAGKNAIKDFVSQQDLIITLFNVMNGRPSFGMSKGGGEIPWYVYELPVVGISVNMPTMLADTPQLKTYINAYDSKKETMDALVDCLLTGNFKGEDPIDSFCGLFDTRI